MIKKKKKDFKPGGFIRPKKDKRNFNFGDGNIVSSILQANGQWDNSLPLFEAQIKGGFDTMNCWNFSTQKCLKTLLIKQGYENNDIDYSERYICVLGGGTPNGGSPAAAAEAIRTKGVIPEISLPWTTENTFDEYNRPRPMLQKYLDEGKKWLAKYMYQYDYVKTSYGVWLWRFVKKVVTGNKLSATQQQMLMDALKYSPIGGAVYAWVFDSNGLAYKPTWASANHWVEIYGYVEGQYWKVYDNYNNCYVRLRWDYNFSFLMRYAVNLKNGDKLMKTIKPLNDPNIYVVSNLSKDVMQIKAWDSYKQLLDMGLVTPYEDVADLNGYTVLDKALGVLQ